MAEKPNEETTYWMPCGLLAFVVAMRVRELAAKIGELNPEFETGFGFGYSFVSDRVSDCDADEDPF